MPGRSKRRSLLGETLARCTRFVGERFALPQALERKAPGGAEKAGAEQQERYVRCRPPSGSLRSSYQHREGRKETIGIETSLRQSRPGRLRGAAGIVPDRSRGNTRRTASASGRRQSTKTADWTASSLKPAAQHHVSEPDIPPGFRRVPRSDDKTLPLTSHWSRQ
jgi:hypothetical protein